MRITKDDIGSYIFGAWFVVAMIGVAIAVIAILLKAVSYTL